MDTCHTSIVREEAKLMPLNVIFTLLFALLPFGHALSQTPDEQAPYKAKIQVTIPAVPCLSAAQDQTVDQNFREQLSDYNRSVLQGNFNDLAKQEYARILREAEQYDVLRQSTLSLYVESLLHQMRGLLYGVYLEDSTFYKAYEFLITNGDEVAKSVIDAYDADFHLHFDTLYLSHPDTVAAAVTLTDSRENWSQSFQYRTYIDLADRSIENYLYNLYSNLSSPHAGSLALRHPAFMDDLKLIEQQKAWIEERQLTAHDIPEDLHHQLWAESPEIRSYEYVAGIFSPDSTVFQGYFIRIFEDTTGRDYVRENLSRGQSTSGEVLLSVDSIAITVTALKSSGQWAYQLFGTSIGFDQFHFKLAEFDIRERDLSLASGLVSAGFFKEGTLEPNPKYFDELYMLQARPGSTQPQIIEEHRRVREFKKKERRLLAFKKSVYERHFACFYREMIKDSSAKVDEFIFQKRSGDINKHLFFISPDSSDVLLVSLIRWKSQFTRRVFLFSESLNKIFEVRDYDQTYSDYPDAYDPQEYLFKVGSMFRNYTRNYSSVSFRQLVIENPNFWETRIWRKSSDGHLYLLRELPLDCK